MTDQEKIESQEKEILSLREQVELVNLLSEKRRQDIVMLLNTIQRLESRINLGDA